MLKDFTIANMLDMTQTIAGELFQGKTYPWDCLLYTSGLSHNTVRGAAGGAVLCAETLKAQGYIQAK